MEHMKTRAAQALAPNATYSRNWTLGLALAVSHAPVPSRFFSSRVAHCNVAPLPHC